MIVVSHPTGNNFVRALLSGLEGAGLDYEFCTTLAFDESAWWSKWMPERARSELGRRHFAIPRARCVRRPARELGRLMLSRVPGRPGVRRENGPFSVDAVYRDLDRSVAASLAGRAGRARAVYAYEDGARESFAAAHQLGIQCCYELPIAYWETSRRLLREEAERWPEWEPTLGGTRDSEQKLERKTDELRWADLVFCPSAFVERSLPEDIRGEKKCVVAEFGSPRLARGFLRNREEGKGPLRVLFAGSMTQRKGLADLFAAVKLLGRSDVELVVMGSLVLPLEFYRRAGGAFRYEAPRAHEGVLELMSSCDVLALPSIVEGRALVQQEALSCGLPILVTPHAGGEDLVEPGRTGFLVPIRDPERIAEKIAWLADHRAELPEMRRCARAKAAEFTWAGYAAKILGALSLGEVGSKRDPASNIEGGLLKKAV